MVNRSSHTGRHGFTLIELVVSLLLVSIVMAMVGGVYVFSMRWVNRWQTDLEVENAGHLLMGRITKDLRYADALRVMSDSLWLVGLPDQRQVKYRYAGSMLYRGEHALLKNDIAVEDFSIQIEEISRQEHFSHKGESGFIHVNLVLQMKQSSIRLSSGISRRQHEPWKPIEVTRDTSLIAD